VEEIGNQVDISQLVTSDIPTEQQAAMEDSTISCNRIQSISTHAFNTIKHNTYV